MTAQQLRAFRRLVQTWRDVEATGNSRMALLWSKAREDVDEAFGFGHDIMPSDRWFAFNHRVIAATHRLSHGAR